MEPILELQNITKVFPGVKALDDVQLKLYPGKVTTLMGENGAGKSTIMKIIFGIHKATKGKIFYSGNEITFNSPKQAMENGISMVHQELNQVMTTRVMDNMWLGRFPKAGPFFVNHGEMYEKTKAIFKDLGINIDPKADISKFSVSERQMIEIARAVSYDAKVLILDEPTSSLTDNEVEKLFTIVKSLKAKGVAILFVSHKMEEIRKISDFVTVFRDGKFISNFPIEKVNDAQIIKDMVGRSMDAMFPKKAKKPSANEEEILSVDIQAKYTKNMKGIKFKLRKGQILGIGGLVGSKRTEILEMLFGIRTVTADSNIRLHGKKIKVTNPHQAIKHKIALCTEERKRDGIFSMHDIVFNTCSSQFSSYANPLGILQKEKMVADTEHMIKQMTTKTPSIKTVINNLSGGNQQKVVVSKWLLTQPDVLLLDEPTRGIDVGAKYQIYEWIQRLANAGKTVIMVSSELPELLGNCHDILVMSNGKQAGIVDVNSTNQEKIMALATKYY